MNLKLKTTLIIIITLIIGVIIGAMAHRAYLQNRIKKTFAWGNPNRLGAIYERTIRPNADQSGQIRRILNKHAQNISKIRDEYRQKIQSEFEAMRGEIDPLLTPEQKRLFEKRISNAPFFLNRLRIPPPPFIMDINKELSLLKEKLDLSQDQVSKVKNILEEWRASSWGKRAAFRNPKQLIQSEQEKEHKIENILTEGQKKLYEQIKKERHKKIEEKMRRRHQRMNEQGLPRF